MPPSAELRCELEPAFKARFGFEMEIFSATGPQIANRVVTEGKAGMRYFDTIVFGSCTGVPLIETKWMAKQGVEASKDVLSPKENEKLRNYLGDKCVDVRLKAQKFAEKVLQ